MSNLAKLELAINTILGGLYTKLHNCHDQLILEVAPDKLIQLMTLLKSKDELFFEQCQDLCGVDYSSYKDKDLEADAKRYAVVYQLLSIKHNWRLRVKCFAQDNNFPIISSVVNIWSSVNWCEREAFDLFGIMFDGHPDLRRILTDYGFIGHPFRKDFPLSGYMEMRYDEKQGRVVYCPVSIEPREITPRVVREENFRG